MTVSAPQQSNLEVIGEGKILIYGSNLPRQDGFQMYQPPILDSELEITSKMTLLSPCSIGAGFHDACMFSVFGVG